MMVSMLIWPEFEAWLLYDQKFSPKPSARYGNRSRFKKVVQFFEDKEFNRTNFNQFIAWMKDVDAQGGKLADSTINNHIKIAKSLGKFLGMDDLNEYKYFRENKKIVRVPVTPNEILLLANYNFPYFRDRDYLNRRNKAIIMLMGTTGCRVGETLELKGRNIHAQPFFVTFEDTKTNEDRHVPIDESVYELLEPFVHGEDSLLFQSSTYKPLQTNYITTDLKRRAKMVGIEKEMYSHLFRHSFITTMHELGVSTEDIMKIVGHKKVETTLRYIHSQLGYYDKIVHYHPLLKGKIEFPTLKERLKNEVFKLFGQEDHLLKVTEDSSKIVIEIDKLS